MIGRQGALSRTTLLEEAFRLQDVSTAPVHI